MEQKFGSAKEMQEYAAECVKALAPKGDGATVLALNGELGAGKTTFTQGAARVLGVTDPVISPTFLIERVYDLENQKFEKFVHIDAYRFESAEELAKLGWDDIVADPRNLIIVEWAEKVVEKIPKSALWLQFEHMKGEGRVLKQIER